MMIRVRTPFDVLAVVMVIILCTTWLGLAQIAQAFHFPWDQGHDTFRGDPGDPGTDPGPGGQ